MMASPAHPPHPWARLMGLIRPDRGDLVAVALFAVGVGVLLLATPIAVQAVVNFVALGGALPPLLVVVALLFLGLCFAGVLSALQTWVVEMLQRRLFVRTVARLAGRLPRAALGAADAPGYGPELVNRYFDLETIQKRGSFLLLDGLSVLLSVLIGLLVLAFYHPLLLAFDVLLVAIIALVVLGPIRAGVRTAKAESTAKYAVAAWLEEIAANPVSFKASGAHEAVSRRTDELARAYLERRGRHFRIVFGQGVAALLLQVAASTALLGIGGLLVIRGSLTLGQLVASELILTLVVSSVAKLGKHLEAFYDLMAATDKVGALLDLPLERAGAQNGAALSAHPEDGSSAGDPGEGEAGEGERGIALDLEGLCCKPHEGAPFFADVSLRVEPGQRVAIRGPGGAGKGTLLRTIWGLHPVSAGRIRIDGVDLREISLEHLRRSSSLVDALETIEATAAENVRMARPFVSAADVRAALAAVGLEEELAGLPRGTGTRLGIRGRPLSTSQVVRLQVARAIVTRPRLLLVSDVLDGLEAGERDRLLDVLLDPQAPWTLLLVSNCEEAHARCDRSYELRDAELTRSAPADLQPA